MNEDSALTHLLQYPTKHIYLRLTDLMNARAAKSASSGSSVSGSSSLSTTTSLETLKKPQTQTQEQEQEQERRSRTDFVLWHACALAVNLTAYVIASAAPSFEELISLIGAALGTLICFHPMAGLWMLNNWPSKKSASERSGRFWLSFAWCCFVLVAGTYCLVAGTYAAVISMKQAGEGREPWSCADNAL